MYMFEYIGWEILVSIRVCMFLVTGWNNGAKHDSSVSEEVHNDTAVQANH